MNIHYTNNDHVYRLKALSGLKQLPKHKRFSQFLIPNNYITNKIEFTLFIKNNGNDITILQIYRNDILFSATNEFLYK